MSPDHEEPARILVVDDEEVICGILTDYLQLEGFTVHSVGDGKSAIQALQETTYDLIISDLKMPDVDGLELLAWITSSKLNVLTIIMTGFGTVETAIEAMKKGAYDYVLKPFKCEDVVRLVRRGLDRQRLQQENIELKEALSIYRVSEAIAHSIKVDGLLDLVLQAAMDEIGADVATLLLREGDGFVERLRHQGPRAAGSGQVNLGTVIDQLEQHLPLLVAGNRAGRYLARPEDEAGLVSFCAVPLNVNDRLIGILNAYSYTVGHRFSEGQRRMLAVLAARVASAIENARLYEDLVVKNEDLSRLNRSLEENFRATIIGFVHAIEESDLYTRGHSERVSQYARMIAEGLGFGAREVQTVVQAGLMHDVGKIGIRYDKLNKPGRLTPEEKEMFRTHPAKGRRILAPIPFMEELIPGVLCHHERWDGGGYPQGLAGEAIPLLGRIVAVADAYDAMTSDRAYRKALPHEVAVGELERWKGVQFQSELVDLLVGRLEQERAHGAR